MIIKNEIPVLEYDDCSPEVIAPEHDLQGISLPEKCLFTFLGDVVHDYAEKNNAEVVKELITVSHNIKIYVLQIIGCVALMILAMCVLSPVIDDKNDKNS